MGGFFDDVLGIDPGSFLDDVLGTIGINKAGSLHNWMLDPLDLMGYRADRAKGKALAELEKAYKALGKKGLKMYTQAVERNKPYTEMAKGALGDLKEIATGQYDYTESPYFQEGVRAGTRDINRRAAATGMIGSSQRPDALAKVYSNLALEDVNRHTQDVWNRMNVGGFGLNEIARTLGAFQGQNKLNTGWALNSVAPIYDTYRSMREQSWQGLNKAGQNVSSMGGMGGGFGGFGG